MGREKSPSPICWRMCGLPGPASRQLLLRSEHARWGTSQKAPPTLDGMTHTPMGGNWRKEQEHPGVAGELGDRSHAQSLPGRSRAPWECGWGSGPPLTLHSGLNLVMLRLLEQAMHQEGGHIRAPGSTQDDWTHCRLSISPGRRWTWGGRAESGLRGLERRPPPGTRWPARPPGMGSGSLWRSP